MRAGHSAFEKNAIDVNMDTTTSVQDEVEASQALSDRHVSPVPASLAQAYFLPRPHRTTRLRPFAIHPECYLGAA